MTSLKLQRLIAELSRTEVAHMAGINLSRLTAIENGRCEPTTRSFSVWPTPIDKTLCCSYTAAPLLRANRDRHFGELILISAGERRGSRLWRLVQAHCTSELLEAPGKDPSLRE